VVALCDAGLQYRGYRCSSADVGAVCSGGGEGIEKRKEKDQHDPTVWRSQQMESDTLGFGFWQTWTGRGGYQTYFPTTRVID